MTQSENKVPMIFHVYQGNEKVRTEQLAQDIIKVGKLSSSHLRIVDDNVSRMHAVIEVTGPDEIFIIDLGSASGTIVNGKKVNKSRLQFGDELQFGDTRVVLERSDRNHETSATSSAASPPISAPPGAVPGPFGKAPNPFGSASSAASPFVAPNPYGAVKASEPAGTPSEQDVREDVQFGVVASGPTVASNEVEDPQDAVEVVILWGDVNVLHVAHLSPPRAFYIGEPSKGASTDYLVGAEVLGAPRIPVVLADSKTSSVVIPPGATGEVVLEDGQSMTFEELDAAGKLESCAELPSGTQYAIPPDATCKIKFSGFTFLVKQVNAGKKVGVGAIHLFSAAALAPLLYILGSIGLSGLLLTLMYFSPPTSSSLSLDLLNADSRLVKYLMEPPEAVEDEEPDWLDNDQNENTGGKGKRHKGDEGQMGEKTAKKTNNRFAVEGPADNDDPHLAREQAREQARNAGILGTLASMTGAWNSPTSPFGRDTALGNDPMSAMGALMGDQIGENFGFGGLGLRGTGRGGGGTGEGTIGLGNVGTIGHGAGGGAGSGYGRAAGGFAGRQARVPRIRSGTAEVRGSLSREVIRRVIQRHLNEVRFCYEQELNARPDLEGRVTVTFIIAPTGGVQTAVVNNSQLGSARVEGCIANAVRRWTFPAPEGGGIVRVNYPFMLTSAGG